MMGGRWWRAYDEAMDDPKLQRLSADLFRCWFNLMCLASKNGGSLPCMEDIAFGLRLTVPRAEKMVEELKRCGLIDETDGNLHPHNWSGRQFQSDGSTERVKRFRKRQRNVSSAVSETPPETDTETETDQKDKNIRAVGKPTRTATGDEFEDWWKIIPKRGSAANPKKPAREKFGRLIRDGAPVGDLMRAGRLWRDAEIAGKRDGTEKVAQAITWLNQERWNDYLAAVEVVEDKEPEPPPGGPTDAELRAKYVAAVRDHEPGSEGVFRSGDGACQADEGERPGRQVPIVQARAARVSGVGGVFRPIGVAAGRLAIVPGRYEPDDDVPDAMATMV